MLNPSWLKRFVGIQYLDLSIIEFVFQVGHTESVQTLFRGNSLASKVVAGTFKLFASGFLHSVVKPIIEPIIERQSDRSPLGFEVDPSRSVHAYSRVIVSHLMSNAPRLAFNEDIEVNKRNLVRVAQRVFDAIVDAASRQETIIGCLYIDPCGKLEFVWLAYPFRSM